MLEWLSANQAILWWLTAFSAVTFVITLITVPLLIVRLPADYFDRHRRRKRLLADKSWWLSAIFELIKGTIGVVLIILGLAMLVLPGQGLLTILIGLTFLNFPGKFRLERWVAGQPPVLVAINWLRRRAAKPAMHIDIEEFGHTTKKPRP